VSRSSLTQLATLQAFVRTGTLAAAAEGLGYTPGAVSQHVAALEKAYGARLVERSGRQLVLTDAGRVLADYADRILAVEEEARHALASVEGRVAGPRRPPTSTSWCGPASRPRARSGWGSCASHPCPARGWWCR